MDWCITREGVFYLLKIIWIINWNDFIKYDITLIVVTIDDISILIYNNHVEIKIGSFIIDWRGGISESLVIL